MGNNSKKRTSTLKHIDALINELSTKCQYAKAVGCPGLVDLNVALKSARKLRKIAETSSKRKTLQQFEVLSDISLFLIKIAKQVYSIIINCIESKISRYEIWNNNTIIAHG